MDGQAAEEVPRIIILRVDIDGGGRVCNKPLMRCVRKTKCILKETVGELPPIGTEILRSLDYAATGFHRDIVELVEFLKEHGDKHATFFINDWEPSPPRSIARHLKRHDLGIHLSEPYLGKIEDTRKRLEHTFGRPFTKLAPHNYLFFKDYEPKLKDQATKLGFKILSGDEFPPLRPTRKIGPKRIGRETHYFREYWMTTESPAVLACYHRKFKLEWLLKHEKGNTIVVCTHETELAGTLSGTRNTRKKLERILKECNVMNFQEWLDEECDL